MSLTKKIKYKQPHSIHIEESNVALRERLIEKEHGRLKYQAKYQKSKYSRRQK